MSTVIRGSDTRFVIELARQRLVAPVLRLLMAAG
jgi:hypothetical protein